jgi:hypothetical protein
LVADRRPGALTLVSRETAAGFNPSSLSVHPSGAWLAAGFSLAPGGVEILSLDGKGGIGQHSRYITWDERSRLGMVAFDPRDPTRLFALDTRLQKVVTLAFDR